MLRPTQGLSQQNPPPVAPAGRCGAVVWVGDCSVSQEWGSVSQSACVPTCASQCPPPPPFQSSGFPSPARGSGEFSLISALRMWWGSWRNPQKCAGPRLGPQASPARGSSLCQRLSRASPGGRSIGLCPMSAGHGSAPISVTGCAL